jgi:hypothetical protein
MTIIFEAGFLSHTEAEAAARDFADTLQCPIEYTPGDHLYVAIGSNHLLSINRMQYAPIEEVAESLRLITLVAEKHHLAGWRSRKDQGHL